MFSKSFTSIVAAALVLLLGGALSVQECSAGTKARLLKQEQLRAAPAVEANFISVLAKGARVEIGESDHAWVNVKHEDQTGWVRRVFLRPEDRAQLSLDDNLANARKIIAVAGLRSLDTLGDPNAFGLIVSTNHTHSQDQQGQPPAEQENSVQIARKLRVPETNLIHLGKAELSKAGILDALNSLEQRIPPGARILLYFEGKTTAIPSPHGASSCTSSFMGADDAAITGMDLAPELSRLSQKASRVILLTDTYGGTCPAQSTSDWWHTSLTKNTVNFIHLAEHQPTSSASSASTRWLQCLRNSAADLDQSGNLNASELQTCATSRGYTTALAGNTTLPLVFTTEAVSLGQGKNIDKVRSLALLHDIQGASDPARHLSVIPARKVFRKGDLVEFNIHSSHAGYLYLIMTGTDNQTFDLLFPNRLDRNNLVKANETLRLPRRSWEVTAEGPAGVNHVLAIVSETPRDFSQIGLQPSGPFSSIQNAAGAASDIMRVAESAKDMLESACLDALPETAARCSGRYSAKLFTLEETD